MCVFLFWTTFGQLNVLSSNEVFIHFNFARSHRHRQICPKIIIILHTNCSFNWIGQTMARTSARTWLAAATAPTAKDIDCRQLASMQDHWYMACMQWQHVSQFRRVADENEMISIIIWSKRIIYNFTFAMIPMTRVPLDLWRDSVQWTLSIQRACLKQDNRQVKQT